MPRTWKKDNGHDAWLERRSCAEAARYVRGLLEEAGETAATWYTIDYNDRSTLRTQEEPELLSHLEEAEPGEIKEFSLSFGDYDTLDGTKISIDCDKRWRQVDDEGGSRVTTTVSMSGQNRMVVEGIFVQVDEFVAKHLQKPQSPSPPGVGLPFVASISRETPPPPDPDNASVVESRAATPEKSSRSWIHNPWTVTVMGGILAAVVAALLIAWLT